MSQLDAILSEVGKPESTYARRNRTRPFKWWHAALIDDMLLHPVSTNKERADRLGYSPQMVMMLTNSDMFMAVYEQRKADFQSKLDANIRSKMSRNATLALDIMHEKLEKKRDSIGFKDLSEASNSLLDRLGYGASKPSTAVQVNVNSPIASTTTITRDDLAEARSRLRQLEQLRATETPQSGGDNPYLLELSANPSGVAGSPSASPSGSGESEPPGASSAE